MPWIRSFRHLGVWVSFTENDWHVISCVAFGFTKDRAEARTFRKIENGDDL